MIKYFLPLLSFLLFSELAFAGQPPPPVNSVAGLTGAISSTSLANALAGTVTGTLAAGNDSRIIGAVQSTGSTMSGPLTGITQLGISSSNTAFNQLILPALPTATTPWQAMPPTKIYLGATLPSIPGDSDYGSTYLGQPYGPEIGGLTIIGGDTRLYGTTYGWSGVGGIDNILSVTQNDPATFGVPTIRGVKNYNGYASRLSYGQSDSHTVFFGNSQRGVSLTLTGLTAANFTTDTSLIDPNTGNPVYRISFSSVNSGGTLPSSSTMASLVPGDSVFTSNGYMALIIKADPGGTWVDVDNWTRGSSNASNDGSCANEGPSVQPSASQDCIEDIKSGGASSLTAYVGTETTFEPLYMNQVVLPKSTNPIARYYGGIELAFSNDSYTMPSFDDSGMNDNPGLTGISIGVQADNAGTTPGVDGVGVWNNGFVTSNAIRRSFMVNTSNATGPYAMQPLCGYCVSQSSTVQNGYENDQTQTTGYALISKTGFSGVTTASIDKLGNAQFSSLTLLPTNISGKSATSFVNSNLQIGWNYSNGSEEYDMFLQERSGNATGLNIYSVTPTGVTQASNLPLFSLDQTGNLSISQSITAPTIVAKTIFEAPSATEVSGTCSTGGAIVIDPSGTKIYICPSSGGVWKYAALSTL